MSQNRRVASLTKYDDKTSNGAFTPFDKNLFPLIFKHLARDEEGLKSLMSFFLTNKFFYSLFKYEPLRFDVINDIELGRSILSDDPARFKFSDINHVLMAAFLYGSDPLSNRQRVEFNTPAFNQEKAAKKEMLEAALTRKQIELVQKQAQLPSMIHAELAREMKKYGIDGPAMLNDDTKTALNAAKESKMFSIYQRNQRLEQDFKESLTYAFLIMLSLSTIIKMLEEYNPVSFLQSFLMTLPMVAFPMFSKYSGRKDLANQANNIDQLAIHQIDQAILDAGLRISGWHNGQEYKQLKSEIDKITSDLLSLDKKKYNPQLARKAFTKGWLGIDFFGRNPTRVIPDIIRRVNRTIEMPQEYDDNEFTQWKRENDLAATRGYHQPVDPAAPAAAPADGTAIAIGAAVLVGIGLLAYFAGPTKRGNNQNYVQDDNYDEDLDSPVVHRRGW